MRSSRNRRPARLSPPAPRPATPAVPASDPAALAAACAASRGALRLQAIFNALEANSRARAAARTREDRRAGSPRAEALIAAHPPPAARYPGDLARHAGWWRSAGYHKRMAARALLHLRRNRLAARSRGWNWRRGDAIMLVQAARCRRRAARAGAAAKPGAAPRD